VAGLEAGQSSIRARIRFWIVVVSTATMVAFTTAAILEERRRLRETEAVHAATLLEHLARMPEFQGTARDAEARLAALSGSLTVVGGRLDLAPPAQDRGAPPRTVLARHRLSLRDTDLELRYHADPARLQRVTRDAVVIHSVHALVALAALLVAVEWILRRNLLAPLRALTHQLDLIRDGRGWVPQIPHTDEELRDLSEALRGMGSGLEHQVREWIEAERRSAVALALVRTRRRLQETRVRLLDLLAELQGVWVVAPPDRERRIRSLVQEVDGISGVIESEAERACAQSAGSASAGQSGSGAR